MGGWDAYNKDRMEGVSGEAKALDTVEVFDAHRGTWTIGPKMVSARALYIYNTFAGELLL